MNNIEKAFPFPGVALVDLLLWERTKRNSVQLFFCLSSAHLHRHHQISVVSSTTVSKSPTLVAAAARSEYTSGIRKKEERESGPDSNRYCVIPSDYPVPFAESKFILFLSHHHPGKITSRRRRVERVFSALTE